MNPYNPYFNPQNNYLSPYMNRLNNLEQQQYNNGYIPQQQFPTMQQQNNYNNQPTNVLQGKVVDSYDVFKAMDVPLDGSTTYFPQVDGNFIYTKKIGMDGNPKINIYELQNNSNPNNNINQMTITSVEKEDIEKLHNDIADIKKNLNTLMDVFESLNKPNKPVPQKGAK